MQNWMDETLTDRDRGLIHHCLNYRKAGAHGLPGHQLMLIICKLVDVIEKLWSQQQS